jgi:hypothetical protein
VTLPTRQQFKCDSPESTVLQDRLRMNCAADARVLFEIELPAMSCICGKFAPDSVSTVTSWIRWEAQIEGQL